MHPKHRAGRTAPEAADASRRQRTTWALAAAGILVATPLIVSGFTADVTALAGSDRIAVARAASLPAHGVMPSAAAPDSPAVVEPSAAPSTATIEPSSAPPAAAVLQDPSGISNAVPAAAPIRLSVETADIDVAVLALKPSSSDVANQSIIPPFTDDGYWLSSYGTLGAGSVNTTYIVGHSWEGREAPFDRFSSHTTVGDRIDVVTTAGTVSYVVDSITTHEKDTLRSSEIWNVVPNRLVIISCYTEDPWGKNVVISALPAEE